MEFSVDLLERGRWRIFIKLYIFRAVCLGLKATVLSMRFKFSKNFEWGMLESN